MKRFVIVLSICLLLVPGVVLLASGGADQDSTQPVRLRIMWWGGQARHDRTLQVIELFQQKNPGIVLEPEYLGWDGYWDRLAVLAAAEDMPDIFQMDFDRIPQYGKKSLLADYYRIEGFDAGVIDPGMRELGEVDGKLLGIVLGTNAYCLAYNPKLLDTAGVSYPTASWTWSDLRAAGLKLREKLDIYGLNDFGSDNDFQYWLRSRGARLYSDDLTRPGWNDPQVVVDFYRQLLDFQDNRITPPAEYAVEVQANEENSLYAQGKAGMMLLWSNKVVSVYQTLQAESGLMVLPGPNSKQGMFLQPSMLFSVSRASAHPVEAARFVTFFVGDAGANNILLGDRGMPVVPAVRTALARAADRQNAGVFDYITMVAGLSSAPDLKYPEAEEEALDIFQKITQEVRFHRVTPAQAAATLHQQWSELLAR